MEKRRRLLTSGNFVIIDIFYLHPSTYRTSMEDCCVACRGEPTWGQGLGSGACWPTGGGAAPGQGRRRATAAQDGLGPLGMCQGGGTGRSCIGLKAADGPTRLWASAHACDERRRGSHGALGLGSGGGRPENSKNMADHGAPHWKTSLETKKQREMVKRWWIHEKKYTAA